MTQEAQQNATRKLRLVTYLSVIANVFLIGMKLIISALTGSLSLFADAIQSISDMLTDVAVLLGLHFGSKEPDYDHPYGHGKLETLSAAVVSFVLLAVGLGMIFYAAHDISKNTVKHPQNSVLIAALLAIVVKEVIYRVTKNTAVKYHCPAVLANAWHDRADAFSSLTVVIGVIAAKFGFDHGDQVAAVAVGIMIMLVAGKILGDCLAEFTEQAIDRATVEQIKGVIESDDQIRRWHHLRTRYIGREIFVDLHIVVDPNLNISDAHDISRRIETTLRNKLTRPINIVIQVEPDASM